MGCAMFARARKVAAVDLDCGATFSRRREANVIERVRVIHVTADAAGIPHVRFRLEIEAPCSPLVEEQRTLALESFRRLYA